MNCQIELIDMVVVEETTNIYHDKKENSQADLS